MHWEIISKGVIPIFVLYDENMNKIDLPKGVIPLDIFISSIEKERVTESIEGKYGSVDYGSVFKSRPPIELKILIKATDTQDYRLLRDEVYNLFQVTDRLCVAEEYQPGKIYHVAVDSSYIPERYNNNQRYAEVEINCTDVGLPFAESIGTTQDIDENGLLYSQELWSYGMGLLYEDDAQKYTHTAKEFAIYNAGNVGVHPFEQELSITIDNVVNGYTLRNTTTGDEFKYTGDKKGKLLLDGANMTLNGLQCFRDTNRQYITLAPGWNYFRQSRVKEVSLDFKFYYL